MLDELAATQWQQAGVWLHGLEELQDQTEDHLQMTTWRLLSGPGQHRRHPHWRSLTALGWRRSRLFRCPCRPPGCDQLGGSRSARWGLAPIPAPQRRAVEQLLGSPPAHPPAQPGPEVSTRRVWEEPAKLSLEVCDGLFQPVVKGAREAPCFVSSLVHFPCVQQ